MHAHFLDKDGFPGGSHIDLLTGEPFQLLTQGTGVGLGAVHQETQYLVSGGLWAQVHQRDREEKVIRFPLEREGDSRFPFVVHIDISCAVFTHAIAVHIDISRAVFSCAITCSRISDWCLCIIL
jgi:hypothetical protein